MMIAWPAFCIDNFGPFKVNQEKKQFIFIILTVEEEEKEWVLRQLHHTMRQ